MPGALLEELCRLETELHRSATRHDPARLRTLLHPQFEEFGRSGKRYGRDEILQEFSTGGDLAPVHAQDFELAELSDGVALLTYRSAHVDAEGSLYRQTLRSSVWVRTENGWTMRFHQGTPAGGSSETPASGA